MRAALAAGLLVALAACGRTPPPSAELRLETLDLREDQVLGAGRDADPVAPGFQLDVAIRVTDVNGKPVPIGTATLDWREEPDARFGETTEGAIDGETARFVGLTLPASQVILRIEATEKDGPRKVTILRRVRLSFDDSRPVVSGWSLPGDANGDGILNITELSSGPVVMRIDAIGMAGGTAKVLLRDSEVELGSVEVSGDEVVVPLEQLGTTGERSVDFRIVLTNSLGNTSDPGDVNGYGRFAVDAVEPTVTLLAPTSPVLGLASDGDPATAGYQLLISARTSADVGEEGLRISFSPGAGEDTTRHVTPVDNEVHEHFTFDEGSEYALSFTVVARDRAGNLSALRMNDVLVDLAPPVISSIANPTQGSTYGDTEVVVEATVSGADGRPLEVFRRQGGTRTSVGSLPIAAGIAQGSLSFAPGTFDVVLEVADAAGNRTAAEVQGVTVNSVGCGIQLTSPAARPMLYGTAHDQDAVAAGLQTTIQGTTPECAGRQVSLSRSGGPIEATTTAAPDGSFSFPLTLAHGEATRLTVSVANAYSVITTDFVDVSVDLVAPSVDALVHDAADLAFVADTNLHLGTPGYFVDEVPGGGAEVTLLVSVTGEPGDEVFVAFEGAEVSARQVLTGATQNLALPVSLPSRANGTLSVVALDAVGNRDVLERALRVDVTKPLPANHTLQLVPGSRTRVQLCIDDAGVEDVVSYDVRYSPTSVLANGIETREQFFASQGPAPLTKPVGGGLLPWGAGCTELILPPFMTYSIQVLAMNAIDNTADLVPVAMFHNLSGMLSLSNPGAGTRFGVRMATADFDGDGITDLAVGDDSAEGRSVTFFRGGPAIGTEAAWKVITDTAAGNFGTSPSAGNFDGDTSAADFIVGASTWSSNRGRALLYFGEAGTGIVESSALELRGGASLKSLFGSHISVIPDLNGDGIDEIAIDASSGQIGQVYLYLGRSAAAWAAAATASDDGGATHYIPVEAADRIFTGPPMPLGATNTNSLFGRNAVMTPVGDVDGDGVPELAIAASRSNLNTVYIYSGAEVLARGGATAAERTLVVSDALLTLSRPVVAGELNYSFGFQLAGLGDVNADGLSDFMVSYPRESKLYLFASGGNGALNLVSEIQAPDAHWAFFGNSMAAGDINGDGLPDLVVGGNPSSGTNSGWILYHSGDATAPYDQSLPGVHTSVFPGLTSTRGLAVAIADVTGDGKADVISSDPRESGGVVYVRH